jgi:hypothetical protein
VVRLLVLLSVFLGGCTSVSEYYSPEVQWSDWTTVGSCGNKFELFKRDIVDGITLEMIGPYSYLFRLGEGKSVQLKSSVIGVKNIDRNEKTSLTISKIKTGVFPDGYRELYGINERHFDALDQLMGTGVYSNIEMMWGEWSSFKGKRDVFKVDLKEWPVEDKSTVEISFPPFLAQGKLVEIKPIIFRWKKSVTLSCVQ